MSSTSLKCAIFAHLNWRVGHQAALWFSGRMDGWYVLCSCGVTKAGHPHSWDAAQQHHLITNCWVTPAPAASSHHTIWSNLIVSTGSFSQQHIHTCMHLLIPAAAPLAACLLKGSLLFLIARFSWFSIVVVACRQHDDLSLSWTMLSWRRRDRALFHHRKSRCSATCELIILVHPELTARCNWFSGERVSFIEKLSLSMRILNAWDALRTACGKWAERDFS